VFNHTAEGGDGGPALSFRGLDNTTYYILEQDRSRYANYSGTGNTLNANHPNRASDDRGTARGLVETMHVDGFRFDLASDPGARPVRPGDPESAGSVGHRVGAALRGRSFIAEAVGLRLA